MPDMGMKTKNRIDGNGLVISTLFLISMMQ